MESAAVLLYIQVVGMTLFVYELRYVVAGKNWKGWWTFRDIAARGPKRQS